MSQVLGFTLRFALGGLLIAIAPILAQRLSPTLGGMILLFPVITLGGLTGIWISEGDTSVEKAAVGSLVAIPAVLAYLVGVTITMRRGIDYPWATMIGVTLWILVAASMGRVTGLWR